MAQYQVPQKPKPIYPVYGNCVKFIRANYRPDMPQGLYTKIAKQNLIKTKKPFVGAIAVTNESASGHLAYVVKVEDEILLKESGYGIGVTTRWVNPAQILGYF